MKDECDWVGFQAAPPQRAIRETGRFLYARHADGAEIEYVEWTPDLVQRIIG
jgi:hypothetical protein